jgi:hypothetical protein
MKRRELFIAYSFLLNLTDLNDVLLHMELFYHCNPEQVLEKLVELKNQVSMSSNNFSLPQMLGQKASFNMFFLLFYYLLIMLKPNQTTLQCHKMLKCQVMSNHLKYINYLM